MATSTTYGGYTAKAQDVALILKFERDVEALREILAASDVQVLAPGTNLKAYVNTCTLQDGVVSPGASITLSTYSTAANAKTLTFKKWRKATPIEAIAAQGYEGAVVATDNQLVRDVQKAVRNTIVSGLATGTGSASGSTFQQMLANTWAAVEAAYEDEACEPVYFTSQKNVAGFLASASVNVQTQSGITYIENFMGIPGKLILDSNVPDDTIYGTAKENLIIAAADVRGIEGLPLEMDESGIIAVHHTPNYATASAETVVYTGLCVFPMFANRVIVGGLPASS